jgi:AraC-like DNA-binding protein
MNDSYFQRKGSIPFLLRNTVICALSLLIWAILMLVLSRISLLLGILAALAGGAALTLAFRRFYVKTTKLTLELDRACRTRLLEKYLSGDVPPEGDLTDAMPGLSSEYFAVSMLQCIDFSGYLPQCGDEHIPPTEFKKVDNWMREAIAAHLESVCTPYFVPMTDGMITLINLSQIREDAMDESAREQIAAVCQGLSDAIEDLKQHGLICGAVVSTVYHGRENIVKARTEAQELTSYAELMGDSSPVKNGYEHSEVPMDLSDKLLRTDLEKKFMQGITNRNFPLLEKTMDSFVDLELRIAPRYPDLVKQHLVSHMEQMLSAFSISVVEYDEAEAPVVAQYRALLEQTSAQQLREHCLRLIAALQEYVESGSREHSDKVERALRYIEENYADPGICADRIGDALGLSASYVSRLLRQNTGMGVVDYIHAARLKKAKELLASTDLSVDDIAVQVGFSSRWTLTRSFKRYEETTPGAYREQHQTPAGAI